MLIRFLLHRDADLLFISTCASNRDICSFTRSHSALLSSVDDKVVSLLESVEFEQFLVNKF